MAGEEFLSQCGFGEDKADLPPLENGPLLLLKAGRPPLAAGVLERNGNPLREEISFFCVPVPGGGRGRPFVAVDRLFADGIDPSEDLRLLTAGAFLLSSLLNPGPAREGPTTLGSVLQKQITAWLEPMDTSPRVVKSDVHPRLMGEVEKILLAAALKKTGYVQTDAARFLGINRNTLAKKIRQYGLKSEQE
jgi:DNA-binding protein Fis